MSAGALSAAELPPVLEREKEIELALSACPPQVAADATVYALERTGYAKVRDGKNGFTALVERTLAKSVELRCLDAEGTRTFLPRILKFAQLRAQGESRDEIKRAINEGFAKGVFQPPARPGVDYMLSTKNVVTIDEDKGVVAPYSPHLMFYVPYMSNADIGSDGNPAGPALVVNEAARMQLNHR